jgi:RNA polymerase sigma factor (sigma-70 family)
MFLQLKDKSKPGNRNSELSDENLVAQYLQTENKELIGILFGRYTHLVYGVCLQYLKDKDQCKDAVMEIFESLFEKLANHPVFSFKNWLYSVSRNHCLMALRKTASYNRSNEKSAVHAGTDQCEPFDHPIEETIALNERVIHSAVENLCTGQRLCISMMYLEDRSYKDITALTGYTLNQVKSHIQNGKRNLKNYLLSRYDFFCP